MKHTKWIAALAALAVGCAVCSNDDDDSANNTPQNNTATFTVTFDADGGTFTTGESDGNAHLVGFDDDEDGTQTDISYIWEGIERAQASDGSYYIAGVDFENGAFFGNLVSWAHERFTQTKLVAYIKAPVDTATLAAAIQSANLGLVGKKPFDVIVFDGKNDGSLESLWPLASSADYIAASPDDDAGSVDVAKLIQSFKTGATAESIAKELAENYATDKRTLPRVGMGGQLRKEPRI